MYVFGSPESVSKQPTQLIIAAHDCHIELLKILRQLFEISINSKNYMSKLQGNNIFIVNINVSNFFLFQVKINFTSDYW